MEIIISAVIVTIIIGLCCYIISVNIDKKNKKELNKQIQLNNQILALYQNEKKRTDTLLKVLKHIKSQLSLLGLPECPQEELKNIPYEIVGWIEQLIQIEENRENGIYK